MVSKTFSGMALGTEHVCKVYSDSMKKNYPVMPTGQAKIPNDQMILKNPCFPPNSHFIRGLESVRFETTWKALVQWSTEKTPNPIPDRPGEMPGVTARNVSLMRKA